MLEDDFHDVVNNEDLMYDSIEAIPTDSECVFNQVLTILKNHVSEI